MTAVAKVAGGCLISVKGGANMNSFKECSLVLAVLVGLTIISALLITAPQAHANFATFQYVGPPGGTNTQDTDWGDLANKVMNANATLDLSTGSSGGVWTAYASSWSIYVGGSLFLDSTMSDLTTYENIFMGTGPVLEQYLLRAHREVGGSYSEAGLTFWFDPNVPNFGYDWAFTGTGKHTASGDQTVTFALTSQVPAPPAVWLFGCGLLGLIGLRRFRRG
jgi:hypothetical protein